MAHKWPKHIAALTEEQKIISDDFMELWHKTLPKYRLIEHFNHGWVVANMSGGFKRTLEVGAGIGEHLTYEKLSAEQEREYVCLDLRENMVGELKTRFPRIRAMVADCQSRLDFSDGYFDRIIAVHVLEHLPDLPAAVREIHRICDKKLGTFQVVIPCEGSAAYSICRRVSAQRVFEKRYRQPYRWFIEREHINKPGEIIEELAPYFRVQRKAFFPLPLPFLFCNLCIAMNLTPIG